METSIVYGIYSSKVVLKMQNADSSEPKGNLKLEPATIFMPEKSGWHMHSNNPQKTKIPSQLIQQIDTYYEKVGDLTTSAT